MRDFTVLGNAVSDWNDKEPRVPQGSVIGPILFIIYINDLSNNITNTFKIYADDKKILARIRKNF